MGTDFGMSGARKERMAERREDGGNDSGPAGTGPTEAPAGEAGAVDREAGEAAASLPPAGLDATGGATRHAIPGRLFPARWNDPIVLVMIYLLAVSAIFIAFPALDLAIAGLFHTADGFPAAQWPLLIRLRALGDQLVLLALLVLAASWLAKLAWPERPIAIRPRSTAFLIAGLILGPGLVVNALLKNEMGRPRPIQVDFFGGGVPFVPAWHWSDYCQRNCSFVSGEASTAIWLLALAWLAPPALRLYVGVPIVLVGLALSLNRMAFGGHFASDVMISWGITLLILLVLHRVIVAGPLGERIDRSVEAALGRAGRALRRGRNAGRS